MTAISEDLGKGTKQGSGRSNPKDPAVLETLRRSKNSELLRRSVFTTRRSPSLRREPFFERKTSAKTRKIQRRRNDDKNNFWEVESKGGVGRGFEKRVDRGPILKFYCRAKAQEKQHFGKSQFYCRRFFPGNTVTIILDNFPPSTLQGVGLGGRKNPRIIVGENYCHFGAS